MREVQQPLFVPDFDGLTYDRRQDHDRLASLLGRVTQFMQDGRWHYLGEIHAACGGTEASVSARLRDLRKPKFGGFCVERERLSGGLWRYRVLSGYEEAAADRRVS